MPDPVLDDARARHRTTLRSIPEVLLFGWTPPPADAPPPAEADRRFVEVALRRVADEVAPALEFFFEPVRRLAHAEAAVAAIQGRQGPLSFEPVLASLEELRRQATDELEHLLLDDQKLSRWVHLAVWADEVADDGYRDPRLTS